MKKIIITKSKEDTQALGLELANILFPGAVITLDGDLGAGKTTFSQGVAKGLEVKENVNSPTFNILKCYFSGRIPLYHIDAYRLEDHINDDIGLEEVIQGDGLCLIEWSVFIQDKVYEPLIINIEILDGNERKISLESSYSKYEKVFSFLEEKYHD